MPEHTPTPLTKNQWRGFFASWGGWALDGMDSYIFALVMVPALKELLPRSGLRSDLGGVGYYGGLLFALFLVGWGCAFLWGPVADKYGRVRTLMFTILWYSLFTFLCCISTRVWQLAIFRFLAGIGIGGEWAMGGTFVAEEWPEDRRKMAAGWMHTGYYVGFFLAALANYQIGARYGWRWMFAIGGLPALLVSFIRYGVKEPKRLGKQSGSGAGRVGFPAAGGAVCTRIPQADDCEFAVRAGFDYRVVGGVGVRAGGDHGHCEPEQNSGRELAAPDFAGDDAAFRGDHSWVHRAAACWRNGSGGA